MDNRSFANLEKAVTTHLTQAFPGIDVGVDMPHHPPPKNVLVTLTTGNIDSVSKHVDIEIQVSAPTRGEMWELASNIETTMMALAACVAGGVYIDDVTIPFAFGYDETDNLKVKRATATFSLTIRPKRA